MKTIKNVIPRVFPSGILCVFDLFSVEIRLLLPRKSMNNIGGNNDSILNFRDQRIRSPRFLASLFMVFEVMFEISIPFVMASLLDQGVQQRNMNNILFLVGSCWSVPFSPSLWDAVTPVAPMHRLVLPRKPSSELFSKKVQTFSFENIDRILIWWSGYSDDGS